MRRIPGFSPPRSRSSEWGISPGYVDLAESHQSRVRISRETGRACGKPHPIAEASMVICTGEVTWWNPEQLHRDIQTGSAPSVENDAEGELVGTLPQFVLVSSLIQPPQQMSHIDW